MILESELNQSQRERLLSEARRRAEDCEAIQRDTGQSYDEKLESLTKVFYEWMLTYGTLKRTDAAFDLAEHGESDGRDYKAEAEAIWRSAMLGLPL